MSCNYPMLAEKGPLLPSGKFKRIPIGRYTPELKSAYPDAVVVPCGKCNGCRADYSRQWADRMMLELDHSGKAIFLTLTYDDEHLPLMINPVTGQTEMTLSKRDWQLFMKRLRKYFAGKELRFYTCGEYGEKNGRPHLHSIIYGIGLDDFLDLQRRGVNELGQEYYISKDLAERIWKNGYCLLAKVSWNTCAYVARYVRKKQFGLDRDEFISRHKEPVFCLSSRNPGIGMYYPIEHPDYLSKSKIYLSDQNGSVEVWLPDAFLKLYEQQDPEGFAQMKKAREEFSENAILAKIGQTDVEFSELKNREEQIISNSGEYIDGLQKI